MWEGRGVAVGVAAGGSAAEGAQLDRARRPPLPSLPPRLAAAVVSSAAPRRRSPPPPPRLAAAAAATSTVDVLAVPASRERERERE
uniref:Uncharacterized protein n=1 Tax=Oryza sativa subsp. japonica TaxID=39947 RepID=Q69JI9_ORYSJ|nr:hypothetical protein [Oryza sativa Japonica Group]